MKESEINTFDFREFTFGESKYLVLIGMISGGRDYSPVNTVIMLSAFEIRWYRGNISSLEMFLFFVIFLF